MVATAAAAAAGAVGAVGISGGGFLLPFLLGVLNMLYVELEILNHTTPVAGASSGAIAATVASGMVRMPVMLDAIAAVSEACAARDNCFGTLAVSGVVVQWYWDGQGGFREKRAVSMRTAFSTCSQTHMHALHAANTHTHTLQTHSQEPVNQAAWKLIGQYGDLYAKQHDGIFIAVTHPATAGRSPPRTQLAGPGFSSPADLVSAVNATTFIPLWSGQSLTVR